jgi:hypothetical protein
MRRRLESMLDHDRALVGAACAVTGVLGLIFLFVWAPQPWGWEGFDQYHQLALTVARGEPFPTMEVPWGYAYFLAAFYRTFGDHPWIPLVAQVSLNACIPWLAYRFARTWTDRRTAALGALLTGALSFNTVYASTQSSDAVCTVVFMAAVVAFTIALARNDWRWFAAAGLLAGVSAQFRPNLILVPLLLAAFAVLNRRTAPRARGAVVLLAAAATALAPWIVRNFRLTHTVIPTSVHGGVQLWYGTLQVGPYLTSRAYNPRSVFERPVFDYTSLEQAPLVVNAQIHACAPGLPSDVSLTYRLDADGAPRTVRPSARNGTAVTFLIPPPGRDATVYYYLTSTWLGPDGPVLTTPTRGADAPLIYFVSDDHLGDMDRDGALLDVFDVVRLMRHEAWDEPLAFASRLAAAGIGPGDLRKAVEALTQSYRRTAHHSAMKGFRRDAREAVLTFADGSTVRVPRRWSDRITDLTITGSLASSLMTTTVPLVDLAHPPPPEVAHTFTCGPPDHVAVNQVFYRSEPHRMRRYTALAFDNIRRDPLGFAEASLYRAVRLFVIAGTGDAYTTQQFTRSGLVYALATAASGALFVLFIAGAVLAWRRRPRPILPVLLVLYLPATISPVLTNMRYSVTVQPIMFAFIAAALLKLARLEGGPAARREAPDRAGT